MKKIEKKFEKTNNDYVYVEKNITNFIARGYGM